MGLGKIKLHLQQLQRPSYSSPIPVLLKITSLQVLPVFASKNTGQVISHNACCLTPPLQPLQRLVGGIGQVTLGDAKADATNKGKKTRLEREGLPVFDTLVELQERGQWRLHPDVAGSVDALLGGNKPDAQVGGACL